MKIKFFLNGLVVKRKSLGTTAEKKTNKTLSVNPNYWYLRHFYNLHGKNDCIEWLMPELFRIHSVEESLNIIDKERPDVLCFSIFVWNYDFSMLVAKKAKKLWPDMKIVVGGPELAAHKEPGFFREHPYIDFVVYGDGERPFTQLLDYFSGLSFDKSSWVNIVESLAGDEVVYPYERLVDDDFFSTSPYVSQNEFIIECLNYNKAKLKNYYNNSNINFIIGVEFARGCMYACTFCDWSQNLSKKVKRGKRDFFKDIDFFYENDLLLTETDANFGQWDEDIEIFNYALSKYDPARNFKFIVTNTPKLKKSATEYIIKKQLQCYDDVHPTIALQDADEQVLKNIDRPALSLADQIKLINNIKDDVPKEKFVKNLGVQLIIGLPGQELDSTVKNIVEIISGTGVTSFVTGPWELLANSPANDRLYQSIHKLKFDKVFRIQHNMSNCQLDELYQRAATLGASDPLFNCSKSMIIKSGNLDWWDLMTMKHLYGLINKTPYKVFDNKNKEQIANIVNRLFNVSVSSINEQKKLHQPLIEKYNVRLYNHYDPNNQSILA